MILILRSPGVDRAVPARIKHGSESGRDHPESNPLGAASRTDRQETWPTCCPRSGIMMPIKPSLSYTAQLEACTETEHEGGAQQRGSPTLSAFDVSLFT